MGILVVCLAVLLGAVAFGAFVSVQRARALQQRFARVVDVEGEIARVRAEAAAEIASQRQTASDDAARMKAEAERLHVQAQDELLRAHRTALDEVARGQEDAAAIRNQVQAEQERQRELAATTLQTKQTLARLTEELRSVEGSLEDMSFGLYKPHYKFDTPDKFKAELERVKDRQKEMVRTGKAASFTVSWTVGNSKKDGERMQKQYCKLMLRAFNGESDAAIAKTTWNNATKMEERIRKAFDAINELGGVMTVSIAPSYRDLKLAELRLEHELEERKREIAEEQRRIREQMRDEEKAQREAEKAQAEAEAEELRFQRAIEKAKVELSKARGEEHARMNEKIVELQRQLSEAHAKTIRAKSIAELTKAGYVYIISNIGSFGEGVFKIGMTRRLEPMDRVKELGDASVPFPFDVHAMVYSENAPALEALFHQRFSNRSVNLINMRKEFFAVELSDVEAFAKERGLTIAFTKIAEAREYRESVSMRNPGQVKPRSRRESFTSQVATA